jgi:hypothetical protein
LLCTGAGLGATEEEAVEADGGREDEATLFVGDLARPKTSIAALLYFCLQLCERTRNSRVFTNKSARATAVCKLFVPPIRQQIQISVDQPYAGPAVAVLSGHIVHVYLAQLSEAAETVFWRPQCLDSFCGDLDR